MNREDCPERIRLIDLYSEAASEYGRRLDLVRQNRHIQAPADWDAFESARARTQQAWDGLGAHLEAHQCLEMLRVDSALQSLPREIAPVAAFDLILVADDNRCFVDVNQETAKALGFAPEELKGKRVDDFFVEADGRNIPAAWEEFQEEGVQCGICTLRLQPRTFEYRAKANFLPGLHLSVLREVSR